MEKIFDLSRPVLIFAFVVTAGVVAPGLLELAYFYPGLIVSGVEGHILSGLLAASISVLPGFFILTITGTMRGEVATNQRFMTEFSFSAFACFLSYIPSLAICYFAGLAIGWFISLAFLFWAGWIWFFVQTR